MKLAGFFSAGLLSICFLLGFSNQAEAANASGKWKSSTGNVFYIPSSRRSFRVRSRTPSGVSGYYKARWLSRQYGRAFEYWNDRIRCTARFFRRTPNKLQVFCTLMKRGRWVPNGRPSYWRRVTRRIRRPAPIRGASGEWRSSTGNVFNIPRSRTGFNVISRTPRGRTGIYKARWLPGQFGRSFEYWNNAIRCTARFFRRTPNKLQVFCTLKRRGRWVPNSAPSYWRRILRERRFSYGANGEWRSSTRNVFNIPRSRSAFSVIARTPSGKTFLFKARWLPGQYNKAFEYWNSGIRCTARFFRRTPHRLQVFCTLKKRGRWVPNSRPSYWTRVRR